MPMFPSDAWRLKPPLPAVMLALIAMEPAADKLKVWPESQLTASLTLMPLGDSMVTPPSARLLESWLPVMSPPEAAIVKSTGSISHSPPPVLTRTVPILTSAAEVSMKPPLSGLPSPRAVSVP